MCAEGQQGGKRRMILAFALRLLELLAPKPATARELVRAVMREALQMESTGGATRTSDLEPATLLPWMWAVSTESRKPAIDEYGRLCEASMVSGNRVESLSACQWAAVAAPIALTTRPTSTESMNADVDLASVERGTVSNRNYLPHDHGDGARGIA